MLEREFWRERLVGAYEMVLRRDERVAELARGVAEDAAVDVLNDAFGG